jgi:hypothetical protein
MEHPDNGDDLPNFLAEDRALGITGAWDIFHKLNWEYAQFRELSEVNHSLDLEDRVSMRRPMYAAINTAATAWSLVEWIWREAQADQQVLLRLVALVGEEAARTLVALDYTKGHGGNISGAAGASWYRRAADHGSASGMNGLAALYATGSSVPKSDVQALQWYMRAKTASSPAYPPYREASAAIALLVKRMTPSEINQARAESQRPHH